jgi:glycosyltransferase involved in cell wall biosynthesis
MKRILHLITTIDKGGAENQLLLLVEQQIKFGAEVGVVALKGRNELENDFQAVGATLYLSHTGKNPILQILYLRRLIRRLGYEIVHAHLPRAELIASFACGSNPLVVSRHNSEPFFPNSPNVISRSLSKFVEKRSRYLIFISRTAKEYAVNQKEACDSSKSRIVYYGTKPSTPQRPRVNKGFPIKVITVGRLVSQKDHLTQIKAISLLPKGKYQLSIYGEGELFSDLEREIENLGLHSSIILHGKVEKVLPKLLDSDLFVLSSRYEGFGLVLLEALEAGLPIMASDIGTTREVLGENFMYYFPVGGFKELAELIAEFGETQQYNYSPLVKRLALFGIKESAIKIDEIYEEALNYIR